MFGIKEKKPKEVTATEENAQNVTPEADVVADSTSNGTETATEENARILTETAETTEREQEEKPTVVAFEEPQEKDKFDLAKVLGKTESGMKKEFYVYQIKKLMAKLGKTVERETVSGEFVKDFGLLCEFGVGETIVSPSYYNECREAEKKNKKSGVKFCALIDYPNGESSFKAKIADVKDAVKNGVDAIIAVMPTNAVSLSRLSEEKYRINKLSKVAKNSFGVGVNAKIDSDDFRKVLKAVEGVNAKKLVLLCDGMEFSAVKRVVSEATDFKGDKELCVLTNTKQLEELSALLESGADKVYSPFVIEIGNRLLDKFGVRIN